MTGGRDGPRGITGGFATGEDGTGAIITGGWGDGDGAGAITGGLAIDGGGAGGGDFLEGGGGGRDGDGGLTGGGVGCLAGGCFAGGGGVSLIGCDGLHWEGEGGDLSTDGDDCDGGVVGLIIDETMGIRGAIRGDLSIGGIKTGGIKMDGSVDGGGGDCWRDGGGDGDGLLSQGVCPK